MSRFHIPRDKNLCRKKNSKGVSFAKRYRNDILSSVSKSVFRNDYTAIYIAFYQSLERASKAGD